MSFLFAWTKYFLSNDADDVNQSDEEANEQSDQFEDVEIDQSASQPGELISNKPQNTEIVNNGHDNDDNKLSDDEKEDDALLDGEEFETLEQEIEFLRQQNAKLKEKYKYHKSQHKLFRHNFKQTGVVTMKINGKLVNIKQPQYQMSLDELSAKVEARLPKFLQKDHIYIPSDVENEIGVIDIQSVDWGDVVNLDTMDTNDAMSTFNQNDSNLQFENSKSLGSPFTVLSYVLFLLICVRGYDDCC